MEGFGAGLRTRRSVNCASRTNTGRESSTVCSAVFAAMKVNLIGSASRSTPPLFLGCHALPGRCAAPCEVAPIPRVLPSMSPLLPCVHSACPARTQPASAEGVRSNSRATAPTVRAPHPGPAVPPLLSNSSVNCRRTRRLVLHRDRHSGHRVSASRNVVHEIGSSSSLIYIANKFAQAFSGRQMHQRPSGVRSTALLRRDDRFAHHGLI